MTLEQSIGLAVALIIMGVGLIGNVLPGIPGTPLVLGGAVLHRIYFGDLSVSNWMMAVLVLLALLALALDYLASMFGAKKMGATWRGVLGAVIGAVVGLFFSLPGILLGPFIGAVAFELMGGQELKAATRAGIGAFFGLLLGAVGKLACSMIIIALFAFSVIGRSDAEKEAIQTGAWAPSSPCTARAPACCRPARCAWPIQPGAAAVPGAAESQNSAGIS